MIYLSAIILISMGIIISKVSYHIGKIAGREEYRKEIDAYWFCKLCNGLYDCKNPNSAYCKWES